MRIDRTADLAKTTSARLTAVSGLLALSVAANLAMAAAVATMSRTVLVPILPTQVALSNVGGVSSDYLEAAARDVAYLFLNRTPDNQDYFEQQILKVADPSTYQAIRAALTDQRRQASAGHLSQSFFPTDWYVDPARLYVETSGALQTANGTGAPQAEPKIYAIQFLRRGSSLKLGSFHEIKKDKAQGTKVPIAAPTPAAAPPSQTNDGTP